MKKIIIKMISVANIDNVLIICHHNYKCLTGVFTCNPLRKTYKVDVLLLCPFFRD